MTTQYLSLEELRGVRRSYVESARSNNFEDGLRSLLADLYPDNAHFIYELLQNAEDARAESIQFDLRRDGLAVIHDGRRLFELEDVESITGIGQSTKKDDETQIGKFGVGFKAVFAYTNRPEVRSGKFAFAIEDLFVPEQLPGHVADELTAFAFPFDRVEKPPDRAFDEIQRGLLDLGEATVLFLNHVRDISFTIEGGSSGQVVRHEDVGQQIRIGVTVDGETSESSWLRFVGAVGQGKRVPKDTQVAAAFNLEALAGRGPAGSRLRVVPLDQGQTCIYFPATKESSGLRFHIHAPFASTVARDSIRDTPENAELLMSIADLVAEQLGALRDNGFIDDGFLAALPNADDPLSKPYSAMRSRIQEEFRSSEVTPVFGRGFARATDLWTSPMQFRRFLEHDDLPALLSLVDRAETDSAQWVAPREGRAGRFLQGLQVSEFGWDDLDEILESVEDPPVWFDEDDRAAAELRIDRWQEWLAAKSDEDLSAVYELIGLGLQDGDIVRSDLKKVRILRVLANADLQAGVGVYLPESRSDSTPGRILTALAFFIDDEPSPKKSHLEAFYEGTGVKRWDIRAQIDQRLKPYRDQEWPEDPEHLEDIRAFIAYSAERPQDVTLFSRVMLLQVANPVNGDSLWVRPGSAYFDEPFFETGLTALHSKSHEGDDDEGRPNDGMYAVSSIYAELGEDFVDFAIKVGCQARLSITPSRVQSNPEFQWSWANGRESQYTVRRDWDIPDFGRAVETGDPALLGDLWRLACETPVSYATAKFQLNRSSAEHSLNSLVAQSMRDAAWVLDDEGMLRTPATMTAGRLADGWATPPSGSLASRIGFGSDESAVEEEEGARRQEAMHLGVPIDLVDGFNALAPKNQARVLEFIEDMKDDDDAFPGAASVDPVHRAAVVGGDAKGAPTWATGIRERQVVLNGDLKERARIYLRELYTDSNGDMWCQSCRSRMPFKVKGAWYFVAMQCVRVRRFQHPQNFLALCPLCAARYKHVRDTTDEALLVTIDSLRVDVDQKLVVLPVSIDGKRVELRLTGKHAIDLKAVLAVAGESRD